jgi:site-specific DNA-cytosine methylase
MELYLRAIKADRPYFCEQCAKRKEYCLKKSKGENIVFQWRKRRKLGNAVPVNLSRELSKAILQTEVE